LKRVAVVGCGKWGENLVRNFAELGALRVACDVDPGRLSLIAESWPGPRLTTSFSDVLEDEEVTAVALSVPAVGHHRMAKEALLAGKDVFVEKPLALHASEGRELVGLAEARGLILMVGHLLRYHPAVVKLKELIGQGALGKLYYIYSNRLNLGRIQTGENILWSFAPHDISTILFLLGEMPVSTSARGGSYLTPGLADATVTTLEFRSGVRGHVFVSWLHPYKEQKLVVVGERSMAVFDDLSGDRKLVLLPHEVEWVDRLPVGRMREAEAVPIDNEEPLRLECKHFLECLESRQTPHTDGWEGLRTLTVLEASQTSLDRDGEVVILADPDRAHSAYFAHETAVIDDPCEIGEGTKIWHFCHVMRNARIGQNCTLGQSVHVGPGVRIGDGCKIQNNVSVYRGVVLEDGVFCGPSAVFTNVINPRSEIERKDEFRSTRVGEGATIGANATIMCGLTIARYAFIGAGSVVTKDVPAHGVVYGNPGTLRGWMCRCGVKLDFARDGAEEFASCEGCGNRYLKQGDRVRLAVGDRV